MIDILIVNVPTNHIPDIEQNMHNAVDEPDEQNTEGFPCQLNARDCPSFGQ